jgi:hypothetical protein
MRYLPGTQSTQSVWPIIGWDRPGAQKRQLAVAVSPEFVE